MRSDRVFYRLPVPQALVVMLGGPTMNLLLAFVLFAIVLVGIGVPQPTTQVEQRRLRARPPPPARGHAAAVGRSAPPAAAGPGGRGGHAAGRHDRRDRRRAVDRLDRGARPGSGARRRRQVVAHRRARRRADRPARSTSRPTQPAGPRRRRQPHRGDRCRSASSASARSSRWVRQPSPPCPAYMWDIACARSQALVMLPVRLYELVTDDPLGGGERAPTARSASSGVGRFGGEVAAMDEPLVGEGGHVPGPARLAEPGPVPVQPHPAAAAGRRPRGGRAVRGGSSALARGCGTSRPRSGRRRPALPLAYVVAGVLIAMAVARRSTPTWSSRSPSADRSPPSGPARRGSACRRGSHDGR